MREKKKEKIHRLRGSFTHRILLTATIFLGVPLLFLSVFLYIEEGHIKSKNNLFTMHMLIVHKIEELRMNIAHERDFLSGLGFLLQKLQDTPAVLSNLAEREGVSSLFHLKKKEKKFLCDRSSDSKDKGKDFTYLIHESQKNIELFLDSENLVFYLIDTYPEEAWVVAFSMDHFIKKFPISHVLLRPTTLSILNDQGKVLASTDTRIVQGQFHRKESSFSFEGKGYRALQEHVPYTNFSLMLSVPDTINFVDIPHFLFKVLVFVILIVIFGGGGALLLAKRLTQPFENLKRVMVNAGKGDLTQRFKKDSMGFEINALGSIFNTTVESLKRYMQEAEQERVEKEIYEKELKIGEEVQSSILPKEIPHFPGLEMGAHYISAKEVGGDFYDFLPGERLMISIADTSGKGISACLYSLALRSIIRSYGEIYQELDEVLKKTNDLFCLDTGDTGIFVTAFVACFDPKTKRLQYSNCGHYPAFLKRKTGELEKLSTPGMALGVMPFEQVVTEYTELASGDLLFLFTDGVIEAHNPQMEMFGEERVIQFIRQNRELSPQQMVDALVEEVNRFAGEAPQHDDLTVLVLRVQ